MRIEYLTAPTLSCWQAFVAKHPDATFYHRVAWKRIIERSFRHETRYVMALDADGEAAGILPMVHIRSRLFGSILCSMPFLNFGGVVAQDEETGRGLLEHARRIVHETRADYLELRHLNRSSLDLPAKTHKVSMTLKLDPDPDRQWNALKSKLRREIRKGIRNGLEVRFGRHELLDDFYRILSIGWRAMGTPIYCKSFFRNVLDELGDAVEITMVTFRGHPVATAFDGFFRDTVEGMWTYSLREYHSLNTNYFLYWQLIRRACERGFKEYHLGRSTAGSPGERYKRKWRAESRQLYWEYVLGRRTTIPELNPQNPKYRLAVQAWRHLPVSFTQRIGPLLARNIP